VFVRRRSVCSSLLDTFLGNECGVYTRKLVTFLLKFLLKGTSVSPAAVLLEA
jgi:hypothetical protein